MVVEWRALVRNATFGPRCACKHVERVAPKVFDIMPQRANHVADVIVQRRLCPKRRGMDRLIYG